MYKAAESLLWKIANELKLGNRSTVGQYFDQENIEKNFTNIESLLTDNPEKRLKIKNQLSELKAFFIRYRNGPAHTGFRFENIDSERLEANSALHNMKCLVQDLLEAGLIEAPKKNAVRENEINLDDIPF